MEYREAGRSWAGLVVTVVLIAVGFLIDLRAGGAGVHLVAWLAALVIIGGYVALSTRAARAHRSLVVTDDELRIGERTLARTEIAAVRPGVDRTAALWGQDAAFGGAETLTRDATGVTITRTDGTAVVVACREPARLARALGWAGPSDPPPTVSP